MITGQINHSKKSIYYICNVQERIGQNIILYLQMTSSGLNQTRIISQWTDGPLEKEGKGCSGEALSQSQRRTTSRTLKT